MPERSQLDWTPYRIGNWTRTGSDFCKTLSTVMHVTHVNAALTVLRDGVVKPQLIYDESRLNTRRILVTWLSPNDWTNAGGFRYGNIGFEMDWAELTDGMRFYWVGSVPYRPVACRILVTDADRDDELKAYDPSLRDGPWWRSARTGRDYWNGQYCLEFMLEGEVPLRQVSRLKFVDHHPNRCSIDPHGCAERRDPAGRGAARFLAGACERRLLAATSSLWLENNEPSRALKFAWDELRTRIASSQTIEWHGPLRDGSGREPAVARAVMGAYCNRATDDRRQLLSFFDSWDEAIDACASVIEQDLNLVSETLARSDDDD